MRSDEPSAVERSVENVEACGIPAAPDHDLFGAAETQYQTLTIRQKSTNDILIPVAVGQVPEMNRRKH